VLNGLRALQDNVDPDDWVLVHDAVRPGLSAAMLSLLLETLEADPVGGLLAIPITDTLKRADRKQRVMSTEPRDGLWQAQTPQMFRYGLLTKALQQADNAPTDEAQAVEALGFKPKLVAGELRNLKITYPQDLALVEAMLAADMKENRQ
jgi:2-C-methyl-D-erythritol 4-phosphate cytidylyltransferase